jgi:hypothetical protein
MAALTESASWTMRLHSTGRKWHWATAEGQGDAGLLFDPEGS